MFGGIKHVHCRFQAAYLEDTTLPQTLHMVPVLHQPVANGVVDLMRRRVRQRLVANVEVQVI